MIDVPESITKCAYADHGANHSPPDPILGVTEKFKADPSSKKINLGVGESPAPTLSVIMLKLIAGNRCLRAYDTTKVVCHLTLRSETRTESRTSSHR